MDSTIGVLLIVAGLAWFLWTLNALRKGQLSENWYTTSGTITKSYVSESYRKGRGTCPIIHYEYSVQNRIYKSDNVIFGFYLWGAHSASAAFTEKYEEGTQVRVYYNPENVEESVLEPGVKDGTLLSLLVSCVPIIYGFMTF